LSRWRNRAQKDPTTHCHNIECFRLCQPLPNGGKLREVPGDCDERRILACSMKDALCPCRLKTRIPTGFASWDSCFIGIRTVYPPTTIGRTSKKCLVTKGGRSNQSPSLPEHEPDGDYPQNYAHNKYSCRDNPFRHPVHGSFRSEFYAQPQLSIER
jgi:hypothetical protein